MISKKILLIVSGIVSVLAIIVGRTGLTYNYCPSVHIPCTDLVYDVVVNLLIFIPLFLLSLITYWMRDEIYQAWFRFARWWVPLSMLLIFLAPEYSADWMYPIVKGTVAFFSSLLFVILSLLIILMKYLPTKR